MYYFIFALPLIVTPITFYFRRRIDYKELAIQFAASWLIGALVLALGGMLKTHDTELWNGQVVSKSRVHGTYEEAYDCYCSTDSDGIESCSTCYETHYTVDWDVRCTVGVVDIKYLDRTSKSVYNSPNPKAYTNAYKGESCATQHSYTNYLIAAESSIFNKDTGQDFSMYSVPPYPYVHSYYKVNRVFGFGKLNKELNHRLNLGLRALGPSKQANIILIGNQYDNMYRYAVEQQWKGGKKNDIIVLIGMDKTNTLSWVDTITLGENAGNELMTVKMRDSIMSLKSSKAEIADNILSIVGKHFDRKAMEEYTYLKDDITPDTWVVVLSLLLCLGVNIGVAIFFYKQNRYRSY